MHITAQPDPDELLFFNGINVATGDYLLPPMSPADVCVMARGERFDPEHLKELQWKARIATAKHHGVKEGVDPKKLDETGWGVIFASDADPAIREALSELLTHRRGQATRQKDTRYKEYSGASGYRHNNSKNDSLMRNGAGPDAVDPDRVPYYLLMVGDPKAIPFRFQYQLDVLAAGTPTPERLSARRTARAARISATDGCPSHVKSVDQRGWV